MTAKTLTDISDLEDRAPILGGLGARQEPGADEPPAPPVSEADGDDDWEHYLDPESWEDDWDDPEAYAVAYEHAMRVLDLCAVCGSVFFHPSYPRPGRPRLVCSDKCARRRDLHLRADLRIARDPGIGSDERKANQIEGLRHLRELQRQDREDAALRRDLMAADLMGDELSDESRDRVPRQPTVDVEEDGSPPRGIGRDPIFDALDDARAHRGVGRFPTVRWQQTWGMDGRPEYWNPADCAPPDGYEPNGPVALQPDGTPTRAKPAPLQPWQPRPATPYRRPVLLMDDLDAPSSDEIGP